MSTQQIPIASIEIDNRMRIDQGSLDSLCESMHERGLLQGIGVQPVDGTKYRLLWGGRRLTAAIRLGWENIEAKVADGLEDYEASELEFMENWERKSMTWTEEAKGLYRIHSQRVRKGALIGESWGQRETGRLLGISLGNVNYTITIAKLLEAGDSEIDSCPNMAEAMRILLRRKEAEAMQPGGKPTPGAGGDVLQAIRSRSLQRAAGTKGAWSRTGSRVGISTPPGHRTREVQHFRRWDHWTSLERAVEHGLDSGSRRQTSGPEETYPPPRWSGIS